MATKEQIQQIDDAFEGAIKTVAPVVTNLSAGVGFGSSVDCDLLHGWGLLLQGAHFINKAKAAVK